MLVTRFSSGRASRMTMTRGSRADGVEGIGLDGVGFVVLILVVLLARDTEGKDGLLASVL